MFSLALKGVRANPFRYLAIVIAIMLGIGFFTATSVLTTSFEDSLNDSIAEAFTDIDAAVRSTESIESEFFEIRQKIPADTANAVRAVDGVDFAEAYLSGYAQVLDAYGKTVGSDDGQAFGWIDNAEANPFEVTSGSAPTDPTDVVIDESTFEDGGFALGDQVRVLPLAADQEFTLVGTIAGDDDGAGFGGQTLSFSFEGATTVFGTSDVDQIFVVAEDGVTQDQLVASLDAAIPGSLEAVSGDELVEEFQDLIGTFTSIIGTALNVFAGVALFVGAFVIYNTFSITVAQRTREMALLRAIGASGRQVSSSILVESVVVGIVASLLGVGFGLGLGFGLLQLLGAVADDFEIALTIPPAAMATGVLIGTFITVTSAIIPARRGAAVPPIEALRDTAVEEPGVPRRRTAMGAALLAVGAGASIFAVTDGSFGILGLALPMLVIAVFLLGPAAVGPFARAVSSPFIAIRRRGGSVTGELARDNASRNPKRSATTSLTLMIGVTLVTTATIFAATLSASLSDQLEDTIVADQVVTISDAVQEQGGGLDPSITAAIADIDGVEAAAGLRNTTGEYDDGFIEVSGITSSELDAVVDLDLVDGSFDDLAADGIAVHTDLAEDDGLAIGDTVTVRFAQSSAELTVVATYDRLELVGQWLVDNAVLDANLPRSLDTSVLVATADGAGVDEALVDALASDPTAKAQSTDDFISDQAGQIDQLLVLLYGLLGMSVVVALIGIVNTMALSIHERTRELGLLRAVGMTNRQLRRTVRYESTIIALMGTMIGLGLGLFFGWLVGQAGSDFFPTFSVPWGTLVVIALIGVVAGLCSGILPARRATKIDILDAVAAD